MKSIALRSLALFLLAVSFAAQAADATPVRDIDELMVKSGLWVQVGQFRSSVEQGIDAAAAQDRAQGKPGIGDAEIARLKSSLRKAFDTDRMRTQTRDALATLMTPEDIREVLVWLNSDLGARITRLEENHNAATDHEAATKQQETIKAHAATLEPDRVKLLQRLAVATRAGEFAADVLINGSTATVLAISAVTPLSDKSAANEFRKRMEEQRVPMIRAFNNEAAAQFGYAFRALSDTEIERYTAFARSPAGERYHAATLDALRKVLVQGMFAFATELGLEANREKPSPS